MGTFKMRLLLIATSLALATAAPHSEDRQKWRPAQGRDLSKFKPKLPEVAFGTPSAPRAAPKPFEFKKVAFSEFIRPSCLPPASDANEQYVGQLTTPVGWGKNADNAGGITPDLNMVSDLPVINPETCADYYGSIIYSGIMCIDSAGGKGVCNGDSGGTLNIRQSEGGNKWTQVGVTSFVSSAGCESGNPHGFSRVAEHLEWIETVTGLSLI